MKISDDPNFKTLIILPPHWKNAHKLTNSTGTRFASWDNRPEDFVGMRFDQVVAYPPPAAKNELELWESLQRRLTENGTMVYL